MMIITLYVVCKLLKKNPAKRLGYGPGGWRHVQGHHFISTMDWTNLREQRLTAPAFEHTQKKENGRKMLSNL